MNKILIKVNYIDKILILALVIFSVLLLPFLNSIPYLDGNIDLVKVTDFYTGGFEKYFNNWGSVHPPLKLIVSSFFFKIGGINPYSYNVIGYIFGILGILTIFHLSRIIFNKKIARICALLLATSPLFLSVGVFSLIDYLLAVLILVSLYFYSTNNYFLYVASASLAVMTKETGLLLPISIIFIEILYDIKKLIAKSVNMKNLIHYPLYILPLLVFHSWSTFINSQGQKPWGDWIFAETAGKGAIYTIINNLTTFQFLNKYAYQHWLQLFILNFNWIYWLTLLTGIGILIWNKNFRKVYKNLIEGDIKTKTILTIIMFSFTYSFTVLTFQTYTIPRYALPLVPFLLLGTSFAIETIITKFQRIGNVILFFFATTIFASLFFSIDPISTKLWGKTEILGENLYSLHQHLAGNDGLTYNMQYLLIVRKRTRQILSANNQNKKILGEKTALSNEFFKKNAQIIQKQSVISQNCYWVFPDPNNDYKTIRILQFDNLNLEKPCQSL